MVHSAHRSPSVLCVLNHPRAVVPRGTCIQTYSETVAGRGNGSLNVSEGDTRRGKGFLNHPSVISFGELWRSRPGSNVLQPLARCCNSLNRNRLLRWQRGICQSRGATRAHKQHLAGRYLDVRAQVRTSDDRMASLDAEGGVDDGVVRRLDAATKHESRPLRAGFAILRARRWRALKYSRRESLTSCQACRRPCRPCRPCRPEGHRQHCRPSP